MTMRLTTLGTLQYSFFGSIKLFPAKAARTTSSTLDDLQLDITLWIHERICEFSFPSHYPLSLRNRRDARTHSARRKKAESFSALSFAFPYLLVLFLK